MKFKAAVLEKLNSPLVIKELETTELQAGQVLVKVMMSGLCGSQVHEITGAKGNAKFLPHMMGHEGCGFVEEIGPGVTNVKVGDKVVMHWRMGKGIESTFPTYIMDGKLITSGKVNTLTEYAVCSENRLTPVPQFTSDGLCCLLGCSLTTAFGVIDNEAELKFNETILILGAGGVGLNLIQAAKIKGVSKIYVSDINPNKQHIAGKLGGRFLDNGNIDLWPKKVDVIIDTTGNGTLISNTLPLLASKGRFILVGQGDKEVTFNVNLMQMFEGEGKIIKASQGGQTNPSVDIPKYINMIESKMFSVMELFSTIYRLDQINEAFGELRSGEGKRVLVQINDYPL